MERNPQPLGKRGSLRWIQRAVNECPAVLDASVLARLKRARSIEWRSPLAADDRAEYRDGGFLDRLGLTGHRAALAAFWPAGGPQWDALGISNAGDVLLVEAKAHVAEMCMVGSQAGTASRARIEASLEQTARAGCRERTSATDRPLLSARQSAGAFAFPAGAERAGMAGAGQFPARRRAPWSVAAGDVGGRARPRLVCARSAETPSARAVRYPCLPVD